MELTQTLEGPTWLELTVDTVALTITLSGMDEGTWGPYADWPALCAAWPEVFAAVCAPYGGPEELLTDEAPSTPMDLLAARARAERRAAGGRDRRAAAARWAQAEQVLSDPTVEAHVMAHLARPLRHGVDASPEMLFDSLQFVIDLVPHEGEVSIGGSRRGGRPDLPPGVPWPEVEGHPTALLWQLDLAELAAVDVTGCVPAAGVVQLFVNAYGHGVLLHHASREGMVRHPPVAPAQHLEAWFAPGVGLRPEPGFYFAQGTDLSTPVAVARALPSDARARLTELFGGGPSDGFGGDRVFGGDPVDWQSMGASYVREDLFCQMGFADGHVSVGWHPDDLFAGFVDDAVVGYCGT